MICELCGKDFIQLGVHLRAKHEIELREYKLKFNIPLSTPLAEKSLVKQLSQRAKERMKTEEGIEHHKHLMSVAPRGAYGKRQLPDCVIDKLRGNNEKKQSDYEKKYLADIRTMWNEGATAKEICNKLGISDTYIYKLKNRGLLPSRKKYRSKSGEQNIFIQNKKFSVRIKRNGVTHNIGTFEDIETAIKERDKFLLKAPESKGASEL